jgi:DNA-binding NtrC family response regulator
MFRPTILIAEQEPNEALSVRKLVVQTAKFNVVSAYTAKEAKELLDKFPNFQAAVVVSDLEDCEKVASAAKATNPSMPVIVLSPNPSYRCGNADHRISSHEPEELVNLLRSLFGDPRNLRGNDRVTPEALLA